MNTKNIFILSVLLTSCTVVSAQTLEAGYGHFGAMIYWQGEIPKTGEAEVRRSGGDMNEDRIWRIRPVQTVADFQRNVEKMPVIFQGLFPFTPESAQYYLDKFNAASRTEGLPMHNAPNVLFALGLAVWDTTVVQGSTYQYQAVVNGSASGTRTTMQADLSGQPDWIPTFAEATNDERIIRCRWHIPSDKQSEIYSFLAYRTAPFEPDYQLIQGIEAFSVNGDTINAVFMDTSVINTPGVYQYMIRTFDRFGLLSRPSEYAEGSNFTPAAEPIITYFKAIGLKDQPAIQLNWKLLNPWRVRSLALYKSRSWSGPYELVSHFSQNDSTYLDPITDVMESYFYYFEYDDIVQEKPVKSVTVTSVSQFIWPAETPDSLDVAAEGAAIRVSWRRGSPQDRGYYVLRAEGYGEPEEIVSEFIHARDSLVGYTWLDTSSLLKPDKFYSYSVISESIGYEKSPPAESISARIDVPVYIPAPTDLKLTRENDTTFLLRWQDLSSDESNNHLGYRVFRKDPGADDGLQLVSKELLTFETNFLILNNITPQDTFYVRALNIFGNESTNSEGVSFTDAFFYKFGPEYVTGKNAEKGIQLKWNKPLRADVTQYHIYRMTDDGKKSEIAKLPVTETTYLDTKVKSGETYYYFLTAETRAGLSSQASELLYITR